MVSKAVLIYPCLFVRDLVSRYPSMALFVFHYSVFLQRDSIKLWLEVVAYRSVLLNDKRYQSSFSDPVDQRFPLFSTPFDELWIQSRLVLPAIPLSQLLYANIGCGVWWLIGRFVSLRPKGRGFESRSSHQGGTLASVLCREQWTWRGAIEIVWMNEYDLTFVFLP